MATKKNPQNTIFYVKVLELAQGSNETSSVQKKITALLINVTSNLASAGIGKRKASPLKLTVKSCWVASYTAGLVAPNELLIFSMVGCTCGELKCLPL